MTIGRVNDRPYRLTGVVQESVILFLVTLIVVVVIIVVIAVAHE
jgi:hypothetical protein